MTKFGRDLLLMLTFAGPLAVGLSYCSRAHAQESCNEWCRTNLQRTVAAPLDVQVQGVGGNPSTTAEPVLSPYISGIVTMPGVSVGPPSYHCDDGWYLVDFVGEKMCAREFRVPTNK